MEQSSGQRASERGNESTSGTAEGAETVSSSPTEEKEVRTCSVCGTAIRFWRNTKCDQCLAKEGKYTKRGMKAYRRDQRLKRWRKEQEAAALARVRLKAATWLLEHVYPQQFGRPPIKYVPLQQFGGRSRSVSYRDWCRAQKAAAAAGEAGAQVTPGIGN